MTFTKIWVLFIILIMLLTVAATAPAVWRLMDPPRQQAPQHTYEQFFPDAMRLDSILEHQYNAKELNEEE